MKTLAEIQSSLKAVGFIKTVMDIHKTPAEIVSFIYSIGYILSMPIVGAVLWHHSPPKTYGELVVFLVIAVPTISLAWPLVLLMMLMLWLNTIPL